MKTARSGSEEIVWARQCLQRASALRHEELTLSPLESVEDSAELHSESFRADPAATACRDALPRSVSMAHVNIELPTRRRYDADPVTPACPLDLYPTSIMAGIMRVTTPDVRNNARSAEIFMHLAPAPIAYIGPHIHRLLDPISQAA